MCWSCWPNARLHTALENVYKKIIRDAVAWVGCGQLGCFIITDASNKRLQYWDVSRNSDKVNPTHVSLLSEPIFSQDSFMELLVLELLDSNAGFSILKLSSFFCAPPNTELNYPISVELCLKNINQRQTSGSGTSVLNVLIHKHVCIKKGFSFKNSKA